MDLISTAVRALVHPFPQNREQGLRAGKLQTLGLVEVIKDLDAGSLARHIESALRSPVRPGPILLDLDGARNTALLIKRSAS
jgi:predicted glycosyltransferase